MAEIAMESVPQKVRDLFNKGFAALERGNFDYAIDMLTACLEIEPALLKARRFLRAAQIQKRKGTKSSAFSDSMIMVKALPMVAILKMQLRSKKGDEALKTSEKLLAMDPVNPEFTVLAADAASLRDLPEAAILTLEVAREHRPDNIKILHRLATLYAQVGNTKAARDCFEKMHALKPNDPAMVKAYKDSMALHSIAGDGWEQAAQGGSSRDMMKNAEEAKLLEQQGKAVKTERDADDLITEALNKLQAEPDNMNYYRQLARLYAQKQQFEEAIATMEEALQRSPGDPELDQMVGSIRLQQMDAEIKQLREAGDEDGAVNREAEKAQFVMSDLEDRVRRYPNDLRLRYDYGVAIYNAGRINDAIQQFQLAQRSPKHRTRTLYYLGLCFKQKGQYDMAAQQLEAASEDVLGMDGTKKDILYELGGLYELMGDNAKALGYYKQIYQSDIGYRDVATKVEQMYGGG
ncbi:MAG: tetratricopeptide repeat protein [Verrucomicrobia bacterium]|nr:tetratricopeptide repeat protein [Verrucomicrobiota bacterium]